MEHEARIDYLYSMSMKPFTVGIVTSLGASLCCIVPPLALFIGVSGMAATFTWLEPARPYLIVLSVACLAFAWIQKLRTPKTDDCGCDTPEKRSFVRSTLFLSFVTVCAVLLMTFPSHSHLFYQEPKPAAFASLSSNVPYKQVEFRVGGLGMCGL